jgi:hypothetical protein
MVQSRSSSPKSSFCFHKSLPLASVLCQLDPVHTMSSDFFEVIFNITLLLCMSRQSYNFIKWLKINVERC